MVVDSSFVNGSIGKGGSTTGGAGGAPCSTRCVITVCHKLIHEFTIIRAILRRGQTLGSSAAICIIMYSISFYLKACFALFIQFMTISRPITKYNCCSRQICLLVVKVWTNNARVRRSVFTGFLYWVLYAMFVDQQFLMATSLLSLVSKRNVSM